MSVNRPSCRCLPAVSLTLCSLIHGRCHRSAGTEISLVLLRAGPVLGSRGEERSGGIGALLGVITLVGVRMAWTGALHGMTIAIVSRILSAVLGLPVFFLDGTPAWAKVAVAASLVATLVRARAGVHHAPQIAPDRLRAISFSARCRSLQEVGDGGQVSSSTT